MPFLIPVLFFFSIIVGLMMTKPGKGHTRWDENTSLIVPFGLPIAIVLLLYLPLHYMIKGYKSEKPSPKDLPLQKAFEALSPERRDEINADVMDYEVNHVLWNRESQPPVWWETDSPNSLENLRELYIRNQYPVIPDPEKEKKPDAERARPASYPLRRRGHPSDDPGRIRDLTTIQYFIEGNPTVTHDVTRVDSDTWTCTCTCGSHLHDDGKFDLSGIRDHLHILALAGKLNSQQKTGGQVLRPGDIYQQANGNQVGITCVISLDEVRRRYGPGFSVASQEGKDRVTHPEPFPSPAAAAQASMELALAHLEAGIITPKECIDVYERLEATALPLVNPYPSLRRE